MKLSVNWLKEWLDSNVEAEALATAYTMSGLEVESIKPAAGKFHGVVVGLVLSESSHPESKRLHCCLVDVGTDTPQPIVCGATNVRKGLKVAVALPGAILPGGTEIQQAVLRGQPSNGMICSFQELGIEDKQEGIIELPPDAPVGIDLREYLSLDDQIIDLSITANRGDCLSIKGLARETSALLKIETRVPKLSKVIPTIPDIIEINHLASKRCPRYLGRVIRNINMNVESPVWLRERLRRAGMRSIHPVVDITNYVMLELGQPLHAFDLKSIGQKIVIRMAQHDESLELLDGRILALNTQDLVIADSSKSLALAGVMGGQGSGVSTSTQDLFLESAFFSPIPLSLTARRYGLQTDSSYRYSRGVDFELPVQAIERATQLLMTIVGGQPGPVIEKTDFQCLPQLSKVVLRKPQIARLLGIELTDSEVQQILGSLGMEVIQMPDGWQIMSPSYRYDISLEVDLIEELGRLHGYHKIPPQPINITLATTKKNKPKIQPARWMNLLVDRNYCETITYSFISPQWQERLDPLHAPLILSNPISSDMSVMRTSLWPGLLQALQYNQNRQISRVRLFESGLCFILESNQIQQLPILAGVASGLVYPEQWAMPSRPIDFYDVKADVEALLQLTQKEANCTWQHSQHPALHPGQTAQIFLQGEKIGWLGALHPSLLQQLDLIGPVYLFELKLDMINTLQSNEFKNISKFPGVRRDIAITVEKAIPSEEIIKFIRITSGKLLNNVQIFDVYQGQNIETGQKSIALSMVFQNDSRTLKDLEIQVLVEDVIKGLAQEFNAKLRM